MDKKPKVGEVVRVKGGNKAIIDEVTELVLDGLFPVVYADTEEIPVVPSRTEESDWIER